MTVAADNSFTPDLVPVTCPVTPEMPEDAPAVLLAGDAAIVAPQHGTLQLRTPTFDTCLIVFLRSPTGQRGETVP